MEQGEQRLAEVEDYNSHNTARLDVKGMQQLLMKLSFMPAIVAGVNILQRKPNESISDWR